jgi:glycosyltransferase involved in cell wall biosynthesis
MSDFRELRVTLVGPLPPPAGGIANQTRQLAELLTGEGACVEVVRSNTPYSPPWIGRVHVLRALFRLVPYLLALWRAAGSSQLFHVMANSGWSWHLFAAPAIRIAALRGVPVVVNYRGGEAASFLAKSHGRVRATLAKAAALVVPSTFLQSVFANYGIEARIVPNVIDLDRFFPSQNRRGAGAHFVVARNLEPVYDIGTAIRAFATVRQQHRGSRLTIVGAGPERGRLMDLVESLGLSDAVDFRGGVGPDTMADIYRTADVMLNPSTADNMPNSILEALASGVAVVSTDVGGVPYLVKDGTTALLVPSRDPAAMAAAALRLLADPALAEAQRIAGLEAARGYAWRTVRQVLADAYAGALAMVPERAAQWPASKRVPD